MGKRLGNQQHGGKGIDNRNLVAVAVERKTFFRIAIYEVFSLLGRIVQPGVLLLREMAFGNDTPDLDRVQYGGDDVCLDLVSVDPRVGIIRLGAGLETNLAEGVVEHDRNGGGMGVAVLRDLGETKVCLGLLV